MFRGAANSVALGLVLAGCSGLAQKDSDQTPISPTAVLEMHMVNEGMKGQPILMNVKWSFTGEACSTNETMKDIGDTPLFTFIWEVKSHRMEPLHDSLFVPPKDYKRTNGI